MSRSPARRAEPFHLLRWTGTRVAAPGLQRRRAGIRMTARRHRDLVACSRGASDIALKSWPARCGAPSIRRERHDKTATNAGIFHAAGRGCLFCQDRFITVMADAGEKLKVFISYSRRD